MTYPKAFTLFTAALSLAPAATLAEEILPMPPIYAEYAADLLQVSEPVHTVASQLSADVLTIGADQSLAISGGIVVLALLSLYLLRGRIVEFSK